MKFSYLIFISTTPIALLGCNSNIFESLFQRKEYCDCYNKISPIKRRTQYPFNQADKIVLISYQNYETEEVCCDTSMNMDTIETPWGEKLRGFTRQIKLYNSIDYPVIDTISAFYRTYWIYEIQELNPNQVDSLSNLMFNYRLNKNLRYYSESGCGRCYQPRNAILFLDNQGKPIHVFEICFGCEKVKNYTRSPNKDITSCVNYNSYKAFFKQCNIHFGIDSLMPYKTFR